VIWVIGLSYNAFNPCTCRDELSSLTIWSLQSRTSCQIVKLTYKLYFTETWRQKYKFASWFLRWCRSHQHVFVLIQYLSGDLLGRLYAGVKAYVFNRLPILNGGWIRLLGGPKVIILVFDCGFPKPSLIWLIPGREVPCGICVIPGRMSRNYITSQNVVRAGAATSSSVCSWITAGTLNSYMPYVLSLSRK